MQNRRLLFAVVLSWAFFAIYYKIIISRQSSGYAQKPETTITQIASGSKKQNDTFSTGSIDYPKHEETVALTSDQIEVKVGVSSSAIREVVLKNFSTGHSNSKLIFAPMSPIFLASLDSMKIRWILVNRTQESLEFTGTDESNNSYDLRYGLGGGKSVVTFNVTRRASDPLERGSAQEHVIFHHAWSKGDSMAGRTNHLEAVAVLIGNGGKTSYFRRYQSQRNDVNVPRGTKMVSLSERYFCQSVQFDDIPVKVSIHRSGDDLIQLESRPIGMDALRSISGTIYFGPRDYFYMKKAGFERAFPLGMLGKIGLILLLVLGAIAGVTKNYGVAIIIFSGLVTCVTAPFTVLSFKSMRKMQQLKPEVDKIMSKYKDEPTKANKAVLELYKENKVSPISGCLPMLLQMPVFIALFQAISHFVELRGKTFLWIQDLSLPDRLTKLPIYLPLIGNDLNLLPIIMAVAMYVQSKAAQQPTVSESAAASANILSGPMMSIIFGLMFYQFPSGLVLYWLTNSLMAMLWYRIAK